MTPALATPAEAVSIFHGPHLCDLESLPREESLRARVLSAHGIAVAWITLDRSTGQRTPVRADATAGRRDAGTMSHAAAASRRCGAGDVRAWRSPCPSLDQSGRPPRSSFR